MQSRGTKSEQKTFTEVNRHYDLAREDLDVRIPQFNKNVELFYTHIDESGWPYQSLVGVPMTFTALFEKMARLNGGKPRGRLVPREGGDIVRAKINNELLSYQWDDATRADNEPMISKWALMDLNARIYGSAFGLVKWRYETDSEGKVIFDGPTLKVLNNKDCLPNPSYSTVKNWFQYRDYLTIDEMQRVNDVSNSKPRYKNLNLMRKALKEDAQMGGDTRESNYTPRIKELQGLTDYLGKDESPDFKIVEVITELRDDRLISFSPRHGVILRDEPNPYKHRRIPIINLKYIPVDDDIYGLSEIQPVEKAVKAINAFTSQFFDSINMDLYRIMQVNPTEVQMHTLEWKSGAMWKMNRPGQSVVPLEHSGTATQQFVNVYSVLTSMIKEGFGELSAASSSLKPFSNDKTATEIQSLETTRNVRDNFNQIFQSEAIKQMTIFWQQMNKQFLFSDPTKETYILRIIGKDSLNDFKQMGLDQMVPDTSEVEMEASADMIQMGYDPMMQEVPRFPVNLGEGPMPKMKMDETGQGAELYIVPEDLSGEYDFIVDVEPMAIYNTQTEVRALQTAVELALNPTVQQQLQLEGKKVEVSELMTSYLEKLGLKGADRYFGEINNATIATGVGAGTPGGINGGTQAPPSMGGFDQMAQGPTASQLG